MAAMAPALTDAPPEAHRIRFKLAPPSTLSPNPVQSGVTPSNGAVVKRSRAAAAQPPSPEHHHHHPHTATPVGNSSSGGGGGSGVAIPSCKLVEEPSVQTDTPAPHAALGRLQPLVASYLCSDVTPVPSSKESLKLQGVALLQTHGLLPGLLPRQRPSLELELSEERLRSLMSGTGGVGAPVPPVNGMAKKLTKPTPDVAERDGLLTYSNNPVALNGGSNGTRTPAGSGSDSPPPPLECASRGGLHGNGPFSSGEGGAADPQHPADVSQDNSNPVQPPPPPPSSSPPSQDPTDNNSSSHTDRPPSLGAADSSLAPSCSPPPPISSPSHHHIVVAPGSLGAELRERTQQSQSRQSQIEGRLRRLRKRLQVVQAKQVERHIQQQLGGLLETTLGPLEALCKREAPTTSTSASTSSAATAVLTPQEREGLSRFLKGGSVPAELERLSLSGATNLHAAEGAFDSDATESSSGGETDVEEEELGRVDVEQRHMPLWRRAEGRYAVDRASIISHWNWLQAHVSDLEYRIRQQTDIYRQIRSSKGPVVLGDPAPAEPSLEETYEVKEEPVSCQVSQDFGSDISESSTSEPGLRKACPSGKQVNGVINNLRPASPEAGESEEFQQQTQWGSALAPSPPDHTCVAARTRPLISCKRRRLVRPSILTNLNRKQVQRASVCRCSCEVNPQCVTCTGRSAPPPEPRYDRPLLECLSQYDPSVHPILSFSDDVTMSLHMQRLLKSHWQSRPLEKIKPIKKLSLKHKLSLGSRPSDPASSSSSSFSKDKHKLSNSLLSTVRLSHHKMRSEKLHRQQFNSLLSASKLEGRHHRADRGASASHGVYDKTHTRKRPREHSLERMESTPKLYTDVGSPCPSLSGVQTPTHSPLLRQISTSSETSTPLSLTGQSATSTPTPIRRRRGESSFDINNIVIPMSVAATTRVEKLQYKEILTPSWREVDVCAKPISDEDDIVEVEDLSDAAFSQLHQPCEDQERSRWTWAASAIAKRRGSRSYRSSDGRTTPLLGGTQPSSPDTAHFHLLQDSSGAPSPSSPPSPDMLQHAHLHAHTHRMLSSDDTRCSTPDEEMVLQPVQPWERRNFPLDSDLPRETDESLECPTVERPYRTIRRISGSKTRSESDTGPPSPLPDESGSSRHRTPASTSKTSHR